MTQPKPIPIAPYVAKRVESERNATKRAACLQMLRDIADDEMAEYASADRIRATQIRLYLELPGGPKPPPDAIAFLKRCARSRRSPWLASWALMVIESER